MPKTPLSRAKALASAWLPFRRKRRDRVAPEPLPCIPVKAGAITTLEGPRAFREELLRRIAAAQERILMASLYLQDDGAGREVLEALYAAKARRPSLEVAVYVDWHRAQRGLVGKAKSVGNVALYREMAQRHGPGVQVYGVPVQTREIMGVLHLKGFVLDDAVVYSGASLNDVYLQQAERYRLDRYHVLEDRHLADCMAEFLHHELWTRGAVCDLGQPELPPTKGIRREIGHTRRGLKEASYAFAAGTIRSGEVGVTPLVGLGTRGNQLNATILALIEGARSHLVIFTPYFNLPSPLRRALVGRLKAGVKVTLVIGDKPANDFYIPPSEPFKVIGILPYLYEGNLRRFCQRQQAAMDAGLLIIHLWRDGDNTYHLKGMRVDDHLSLFTGSNLNPRAWRLDLENGLLVSDPQGLLKAQSEAEMVRLLAHATRLRSYKDLQTMADYPPSAQKVLKRFTRVRLDRLVNKVI